ncbi:MAG TPA: PEP/pyruvate-binding domain-containing protein [Solirubrobacteraceae bacterium]
MSEHTRLLAELRRDDEPSFGGKSASLGELMAAGIPVPPGFAVGVSAFAAHVAGVAPSPTSILEGLDHEELAALRSASARASGAVAGAELPHEVAAEIRARYASLGEGDPPVAVRSSALGEDSAEAAFAGQQETFLWVRGADAVVEAVRSCWASLYSAPAVAYRARLGDAATAPAMGVAVQEMIDAEVAGVLFTCNPVSGDPSTVAINASWGLGVGVVGGDVTPDDLLISKVTREVVRQTIAVKEVEHRPRADGLGTEAVPVEAERAAASCLGEEQLGALIDLARLVERHFGGHQDVEWALDREGSLFVLQSRPVTAAGRGEKPAAPKGSSAIAMVMSTFGVEEK